MLHGGGNCVILRSLVLRHYQRVTDGQTDRHPPMPMWHSSTAERDKKSSIADGLCRAVLRVGCGITYRSAARYLPVSVYTSSGSILRLMKLSLVYYAAVHVAGHITHCNPSICSCLLLIRQRKAVANA